MVTSGCRSTKLNTFMLRFSVQSVAIRGLQSANGRQSLGDNRDQTVIAAVSGERSKTRRSSRRRNHEQRRFRRRRDIGLSILQRAKNVSRQSFIRPHLAVAGLFWQAPHLPILRPLTHSEDDAESPTGLRRRPRWAGDEAIPRASGGLALDDHPLRRRAGGWRGRSARSRRGTFSRRSIIPIARPGTTQGPDELRRGRPVFDSHGDQHFRRRDAGAAVSALFHRPVPAAGADAAREAVPAADLRRGRGALRRRASRFATRSC